MNSAIATCVAKKVVICADDFGLTVHACDSIIKLAKLNAISAASCVSEGPWCEQNASALLEVAGRMSLGLHINLTEHVNDRRYVSLRTWLFRCFVLRHADKKWLAATLTRQLDRFENLFKRAPDFVDGHEHVHQFPIVRDVLLELLQRRYVAPIAVRTTTSRVTRGAKAALIARLGGHALRQSLLKNKFSVNADFAGVYDFSTRVAFAARLHEWLASIDNGGLIMCHPEFNSKAIARLREHEFLSSSAWPALQRNCNVQLIPFNVTSLAV